ncbi:MAG: hypothetical protein ACRDZW_11145, partial [Acidimicrobiales bacterium]
MRTRSARILSPVASVLLLTSVFAGLGIVGATSSFADADLSVTIADTPDPVAAGSNIIYTIT